MKILSLTIKNIRGIRDLSLNPEGKNLVIWGNNGSGKSAVVDALDFLLTGKMNRLMGKGTAGIFLLKHGSHIDCENHDDAYVTAKIVLPSKEVFNIKRCLTDATIITESNGKSLEPLAGILNLADRGQHVLTRREILKFVTAEGKTRSEEIQNLLNINEIEEVRKTLVTVNNTQKNAVRTSKSSLDQAKIQIQTTTEATNFQEPSLLKFINQKRKILGADEINDLNHSSLKQGIAPITLIKNNLHVNPDIVRKDIANLNSTNTESHRNTIIAAEHELDSIIQEINADAQNVLSLRRKKLIDLGIEMLGDDCNCPLCDSEWQSSNLRHYLLLKQEKADFVTKHKSKIDGLVKTITTHAQIITSSLTNVLKCTRQLQLDSEAIILETWNQNLADVITTTTKVASEFEFNLLASKKLSSNLSIPNLLKIEDVILKKIEENVPKVTPEQTAWDILTRLEENLKVYKLQLANLKKNELNSERTSKLLGSFEKARDQVLQGLYDEIRGKFEVLYKELHGTDEENFASDLQPSGAGMKFEVDFYGRGKHPPHAMHSEGHQDSMGLCLYLALSEKLTNGFLDIVILDDVVMSVDIEHRKQLCTVLRKNFPNKQFVITTHDQTWAQMLKSEKVVSKKGLKEFFNWTVTDGPNINDFEDFWDKINTDLIRGDANGAAAKLRRGLEQFFYEVCEKLQAQIRFKSGGRWDLGDLSQAGISSLNNVISKAKESANSWNDKVRLESIKQLEVSLKSILGKLEQEKWLVNPAVHYTDWLILLPTEFKHVVNSYRKLCEVFSCDNPECRSPYYLTNVGMTADTLRCKCGKVNWALNTK